LGLLQDFFFFGLIVVVVSVYLFSIL